MHFFARLKDRTKLLRKRPLHRMKMWLKYCSNRESKDPVFVITTRRSGSSLLIDYLKSVPAASFDAEILNARMSYGIRPRFISKKAVLRHIAHTVNYAEHRMCGAKLISSQMQTHGITLGDLKSLFPSVRFIVLYRQSLFDQYVSLKIAEKTDVWQWVDGGFTLPDAVDFDLQEFDHFCTEVRSFYEGAFALPWVRERSLVISYEELISDAHSLFDRSVFPFLGMPSSEIRSVTKKQNHKQPSEIVRRYGEIMASLDEAFCRQDYSVVEHSDDSLLLEKSH